MSPSSASTSLDATPGMAALLERLRDRRVVVLSGAGCSTESGIPDYRGPDGRLRAATPIQYNDFVRRGDVRARYWARSAIGWPRVSAAAPNAAHRALARLEENGIVEGVITQNVDGLHQAAGSRAVVELHGSLGSVVCLGCGGRVARSSLQERLLALNPGWHRRGATGRSGEPPGGRARHTPAGRAAPAPDGDATLPDAVARGFRVPDCDACGGVLKPDVVFFGENVPRERVGEAWGLFGGGEVLLVVGSSLTVYSGRRFIYRAEKEGVPVAIVNQGTTRADAVAAVKVEGRVGEVLPRVAEALVGPA